MNLLLISREYPPFFGGGIGAYADRFTRALAERGHRIIVATVSGSGCEEREERAGVTIVGIPFLEGERWTGPHPRIDTPSTRAAWKAFWGGSVLAMQIADALPRLCAEFAIEAIEAPDTGALAWFALNRRRNDPGYRIPPVVTVIHSPTEWVERLNRSRDESRAIRELALMERDGARWSEALLCPSASLARAAERLWEIEPGTIATVPYALGDLESATRASDASPDPSTVAFFGRLEYRKGIDTLLGAFASAARESDLTLDLVGADTDDPERPGPLGARLIRDLVPPELRPRIRLHGKQPPDRVADLRRGAAAIVIPSPDDNFPLTCVEAMADARLVIAARSGGMAEMIRDGIDGLLFNPGDPTDLAAALRRAIRMPRDAAAAMGRSAAARILDLCGNNRIVGSRLAHFQEVVRRACAAVHERAEDLAWIRADTLAPGDRARLAAPLRIPEIDFAHPWLRTPAGEAIAFGPPSPRTAALAPPMTGPLAVRAPLADRLGLRTLDAESAFRVLLAAGASGAVVPEVLADQSRPRPRWRRVRELLTPRRTER